MKSNTFTTVLAMLMLAFLWSCQQEVVNPTDAPIATRGHKPNHAGGPGGGGGGNGGGGNGGGGDEGGADTSIYAVQYTGSIISSDVAYLRVTKNTGKVTELHSLCDAALGNITEDTISTVLEGLNELFTYLTPPATCYDQFECSLGVTMNQFNKKQLPDRIRVTFWFEDPSAPDGILRFVMFGTIVGEFPPTTTSPTVIRMDKWVVDAQVNYDPPSPECMHENTLFSDDGIPDQEVTIRLVDQETEGDGPALCATKAGCAN